MSRLSDYVHQSHRAVVRVDMNVPMHGGQITDDQRIRACLATIRMIVDAGGSAIVLSHLGRPQEGQAEDRFSLRPVAERLQQLLERPVRFSDDYLHGLTVHPGETVMCENVRFNPGERANDQHLAQALASLGDLFVMDAFACAHRAHASTCGAIACAPQCCAGPLLEKELSVLGTVVKDWQRPVVAIIGGAKISSKLKTLAALAGKVDDLVLGGGIANTVLASQGHHVGCSLIEKEWFAAAQELLHRAQQSGVRLHVPMDVVCADNINASHGIPRRLEDIGAEEMILDLGRDSIHKLQQCLHSAKTILWSGPLGVFENPAFAHGTQTLAQCIAAAEAKSVAGGGDTLAAIAHFGVAAGISHISTGGSAFLHFIEGRELPAVAALEAHHSGVVQ